MEAPGKPLPTQTAGLYSLSQLPSAPAVGRPEQLGRGALHEVLSSVKGTGSKAEPAQELSAQGAPPLLPRGSSPGPGGEAPPATEDRPPPRKWRASCWRVLSKLGPVGLSWGGWSTASTASSTRSTSSPQALVTSLISSWKTVCGEMELNQQAILGAPSLGWRRHGLPPGPGSLPGSAGRGQ